MVTRFPRGHFSCLYIIRIKEHTAGHLGSEKTKSDDNIWAFGWICNPPGLSISIFNALYRIKNPNTQDCKTAIKRVQCKFI